MQDLLAVCCFQEDDRCWRIQEIQDLIIINLLNNQLCCQLPAVQYFYKLFCYTNNIK